MAKETDTENSIKVLLCSPLKGTVGGITVWTQNILGYYNQNGPDTLRVSHFDVGRKTFVNINSPLLFRVWAGLKDYHAIVRDFRRAVWAGRFDVVHLTSSASISLLKDLLMIRIAKRSGARALIHFHFGRIPQLAESGSWEWRLLKRVVRKADRVVVMDAASYRALRNAGFDNVDNLPNPVSGQAMGYFSGRDPGERDPGRIFFAGHVVVTKGVRELVEACAAIPGIRLDLYGKPLDGMKELLESEAAARSGGISWLNVAGEKSYADVLEGMARCGVFVLPTYTEGFPNVILEAMAAGCPIVTTPVGAIPEMLDMAGDAPCGVVVPPKDADALRDAVAALLCDRERAAALGRRAQERVRREYTAASVWKQMEQIYLKTAR